MVDEYHGCRYWHPFRADGMRRIRESKLRPQARWGLCMSQDDPAATEEERQKWQATEEDAKRIHDHDFRNYPAKERYDPPLEGYQVGFGDPSDDDESDEE
jgi:hypothetical protein